MSKITIGIAGMGWLGQPLAHHFEILGYKVKGSVTKHEKAQQLKNKGFNVTTLMLTENGTQGTPVALLADTDILLVMIPPGLRGGSGSNYALKMAHFVSDIERFNVKKVVLVSSTSVYDDTQGVVTEDDRPLPELNAGKQLLEVEQLFSENVNFECTIVRFGGLIGGSRNPIRFLAGRKGLSNGSAPVNLIHRDDCIAILSKIVRKNFFGYLFNAVCPDHPSKKEYYTRQANELGLVPPEYEDNSDDIIFKQIDSSNIPKVLSYTFKKRLV